MQTSEKALTAASLERLLAALDDNREAAGQKYESLRRGVVRFFEWRGCWPADEYADEALDRTARKLDAGSEINDVYPYVLGVARFLLMEFRRDQEKQRTAFREFRRRPAFGQADADDRRLVCVDKCLQALSAEERELILSYYREQKQRKIDNRRSLAERLGISMHTLRMRAHRLRARLEACVSDCARD